MPEPRKYVVGREAVIEILREFIESKTGEFILNIYGPGGIGKTEVCSKITAYCQKQNWTHMFVQIDAQIDTPNFTFDRILFHLKDSLFRTTVNTRNFYEFFKEFEYHFSEYLIMKELLERAGGISELFDITGNVIPGVFTRAIVLVGESVTDEIRQRFRNRYALQEYRNDAEQWLTKSFVDGLSKVRTHSDKPIVIMMDTYEKVSYLDEWICNKLARMLPDGIQLIVSGRDRLQDMGFHWIEYAQQISSYELPELSKESTFDFYQHFGLTDPDLLKAVYDFTGGYPLCMTLAVDLARESGWEQLAGFKRQRDKYEVARHLLDRLLEQEGVAEVREFLEKGVVTLWFDIEAIAFLLDVPLEKAEDVFNKISRFSFTTRTEFGLKFHDRVRDILLERLKYMDRKLFEELLYRWRSYYRPKVAQEWLEI
jgi:hypothetical protein